MILIDFFLENLHFALNIFVAFVFFAVAWLYLDAWMQTKRRKELPKILGFIVLSLSFLVHSTQIEQVAFVSSILDQDLAELASNILRVVGYFLLIVGLIIDPIQKKPVYENGQVQDNSKHFAFLPIQSSLGIFWYILTPILSFGVFLLFLRRSTKGLEKHLRPLTAGFFFIFLYELVSLSGILEGTTSISIYQLIKPLGPVWIIAHLLLLIGIIIIAKWVFGYLLKRIQTQFFMILNFMVLVIFLVTTVSFTTLLLTSLRDSAISHLATDVKVVSYAISAKQEETLSDSEVVAQNPEIVTALTNGDTRTLKDLSTSILIAKRQSYLIILDSGGQVLARGENSEKSGDSMSSDSLFQKAINGEKTSSVVVKEGPLSPIVSIRSSSPVGSTAGQLGVVIVGTDIDNAFVDGLKNSTGLDVAVYGGNILSATTFTGPDGKSRFVGIKEDDEKIHKFVLNEGEIYSGESSILNTPYFVSFAPLKDNNGNNVGMIFAGEEASSLLRTTSKALEFTFAITALLILLSIIPSFLISRYITRQFR